MHSMKHYFSNVSRVALKLGNRVDNPGFFLDAFRELASNAYVCFQIGNKFSNKAEFSTS
jgi:hypothetical protein